VSLSNSLTIACTLTARVIGLKVLEIMIKIRVTTQAMFYWAVGLFLVYKAYKMTENSIFSCFLDQDIVVKSLQPTD